MRTSSRDELPARQGLVQPFTNMRVPPLLPDFVTRAIRAKQPLLWLNDSWRSLKDASPAQPALQKIDVVNAELRLQQYGSLLLRLFAELAPTNCIIESALYPAGALRDVLMPRQSRIGRWLIKGDHALPVAGSIKARGGIYEVLLHAERLALQHGVIAPADDRRALAEPTARALFAHHKVLVGSTGNLGMSIGTIAAALGFRAIVHMSRDAKEWKKALLRERGVEVIEHHGDYGSAVMAGRRQAEADPRSYFVDDENSVNLFLGYSAAAIRLEQQLAVLEIEVDARHPLFVYLPCGVGGAPGGITFGLRHIFGDHVHCFFAEPVTAPCMLLRLAALTDEPVCVGDHGLLIDTQADGLAVAQASELVARIVRPLVSGAFTVSDDDLFEDLYVLERSIGLRIEPSAAAGFRGPHWLLESAAGQHYLSVHGLTDAVHSATHILWTTGGASVPDEEYRGFHDRGRNIRCSKSIRTTHPGN